MRAATSATEIGSWQSWAIDRRSRANPSMFLSPLGVVTTSVSIGRSASPERVRPPVIAYGRTMRMRGGAASVTAGSTGAPGTALAWPAPAWPAPAWPAADGAAPGDVALADVDADAAAVVGVVRPAFGLGGVGRRGG